MLLSWGHRWQEDPNVLHGRCPPWDGIAKSSFSILLGRGASPLHGLWDASHGNKAAPRGESVKKNKPKNQHSIFQFLLLKSLVIKGMYLLIICDLL